MQFECEWRPRPNFKDIIRVSSKDTASSADWAHGPIEVTESEEKEQKWIWNHINSFYNYLKSYNDSAWRPWLYLGRMCKLHNEHFSTVTFTTLFYIILPFSLSLSLPLYSSFFSFTRYFGVLKSQLPLVDSLTIRNAWKRQGVITECVNACPTTRL